MRWTTLFESSIVKILEVSCEPGLQPPSPIEVQPAFELTLPRRGVYVHQTPAGRLVADPTVAIFRNEGEEQITTHPTSEGDTNTDIQFRGDVVEPFLDRHGRFLRRTASSSLESVICHQRMLSGLRSGAFSALETEEHAFSLLWHFHSLPPEPESPRHRALIEDARSCVAATYRENLGLAAIAARVGSSPSQLSRVFKAATGSSLTRYRATLRVRHVLERLMGCDDLARLAVEAGFFDQAHMTNTVRREAGASPTVLRRLMAS